jgi:hypothetical protein
MRDADLKRFITNTGEDTFGFLVWAKLLSAPQECPACGHGDKFLLCPEKKTQNPRFWCHHVTVSGHREESCGTRTKTVGQKTCMKTFPWRKWSDLFDD